MTITPKVENQIINKINTQLTNVTIAFTSSFAIVFLCKAMRISNEINFYFVLKDALLSSSFMLLFIGLMIIFCKKPDLVKIKSSLSTSIASGVFTILTIIGQIADLTSDFPHDNLAKIAVLEIINLVGLFLVYQFIIAKLFNKLDAYIQQTAKKSFNKPNQPILKWIENHIFIFSLIVLMVFWAPIQVWILPGIIRYDGFNQLNQYFQLPVWSQTQPLGWSNHHPLVSTLIMGGIIEPFMKFGADKAVFVYTMFQTIFNALAISFAITKIQGWVKSVKFSLIALLFFAFSSVLAIDNMSVIKDTLFIGIYLLVGIFFIDLVISGAKKEKYSLKTIIGFVFFTALAMLYRANAVYVIAPTILLLIFVNKRHVNRIIMVLILFATLGTYKVTNTVLINHFHAASTEITEALSIPLQQTARTLKYQPKTVTPTERNVINKVIDVNEAANLYDPLISDAVKRSRRTNGNIVTKDQVLKYLTNAWFPGLLKTPLTYIKATIYNTYLYFYPWSNRTVQSPVVISNSVARPMKTHYFDYKMWFGVDNDNASPRLARFIHWFMQTMPIGLLFNNAMPFWIFIGLMIYLISRKYYYGLLLIVGPALNFLVLLAGPVNGLLRYTTPVATWLPIVLAGLIIVGANKQVVTDQTD